MILKIGLTGGIGSGKTTVAKIFELLNIPVYYADDAAKRLYRMDKGLINDVKKHFGEDLYTGNQLNKKMLADIVFNNKEKLELLNQLVHPRTISDAEQWMENQVAPYIIKEAALLFEGNAALNLDYIIGVSAPLELRIKRTMERDKITKEDVLKRSEKQMEETKKMSLCDFIITNDEEHLIIPQVLELHKKFLLMSKT